jgi:ankyrin repeat protein
LTAKKSETPLHSAVEMDAPQIARLLIEGGAAVDAVDGDGATPLHLAALHGNLEKAKALIENGASLHLRTRSDETALDIARGRGDEKIVEYLNAKNADDYRKRRLI